MRPFFNLLFKTGYPESFKKYLDPFDFKGAGG